MYAADSTIFHDITVGDNKCTEDGCGLGNCQGYECTQGWDGAFFMIIAFSCMFVQIF
jgi:hypothetical protein